MPQLSAGAVAALTSRAMEAALKNFLAAAKVRKNIEAVKNFLKKT